MSNIYPGGDHQYSTNLGLGLWGTDEVTTDNFLLIDAAIGSGSSVRINSAVIPNPNFINSASATFSVAGSNVSITAGGSPGGSPGDIQYNNAGMFGGSSTFTFSPTVPTVTITDASGTASILTALQPVGNVNYYFGDDFTLYLNAIGTTSTASIELHNVYDVGINIYDHATNGHLGNGPSFNFFSSGGTQAAPTATLTNQALAIISASGYDGSSYYTASDCAYYECHATENWSSGHRGSGWDFYAVPNGGTNGMACMSLRCQPGSASGMALFGNAVEGTSSYATAPAVKNGGIPGTNAVFAIRLGDDSADCPMSAGSAVLSGNLTLESSLTDSSASVGTLGQVLESTVTGVKWVTAAASLIGTAGQIVVSGGAISIANPFTFPGPASMGTNYISEARVVTAGGTTTAGYLVSTAATGNVQTSALSATEVLGIATTSQTAGQNVEVARIGLVTAIADNTVTTDNMLGVGTTTAGRVRDLGSISALGVSNQLSIVGKALTSAVAGGAFTMQVYGPGFYGGLAVASAAWSALTGDLTETQVIPWDGGTIGTPDTGISRIGAASLAIGNGTAGSFVGGVKMGALYSVGTSETFPGSYANNIRVEEANFPAIWYNRTSDSKGFLLAVDNNGFNFSTVAVTTPTNVFYVSPAASGRLVFASGVTQAWGTANGDVGISRLGAASLAIGNGTAGDTSGTLTLTKLSVNLIVGPVSYIQGPTSANGWQINYYQPGFGLGPTGPLTWGSASANGADTGISRLAAGSLAIGNGTVGSIAGNLSYNRVNTAGSDFAGQATVTAGNTTKAVAFANNYTGTGQPVVVLTPTSDPLALGVPVGYWVTYSGGTGAWTGFTVSIQTALAGNVTFNYVVIGVA
jgi:hypothetical protein